MERAKAENERLRAAMTTSAANAKQWETEVQVRGWLLDIDH